MTERNPFETVKRKPPFPARLLIAGLVSNATSLAFVVAAAFLAASGHDGWGWCILGAIVTHASYGGSSRE